MIPSEKEMMRHVKHIRCRRIGNCKNKKYKGACIHCSHNENSVFPKQDNYKEIIPGLKFL